MQENPQSGQNPPPYTPEQPPMTTYNPPGYNTPGAPIPMPGAEVARPYSGVNDSGTGATAVLPDQLRGFNWGAFLMNWLWAVNHATWLGLLCFVPYAGVVMQFMLGFKGNEWAWQNRKWDSIEHFQETQKVWTKWGVGLLIVGFVLGVLFVFAAIIAGGASGGSRR